MVFTVLELGDVSLIRYAMHLGLAVWSAEYLNGWRAQMLCVCCVTMVFGAFEVVLEGVSQIHPY